MSVNIIMLEPLITLCSEAMHISSILPRIFSFFSSLLNSISISSILNVLGFFLLKFIILLMSFSFNIGCFTLIQVDGSLESISSMFPLSPK